MVEGEEGRKELQSCASFYIIHQLRLGSRNSIREKISNVKRR